jgi:hypothetical protein
MKNKKSIDLFEMNKLNNFSRVNGGEKRVIESGTTPCGQSYQIIGSYFLGIHYGTDKMVADPVNA